eukprot:3267736-Rhodomonas_salina.1
MDEIDLALRELEEEAKKKDDSFVCTEDACPRPSPRVHASLTAVSLCPSLLSLSPPPLPSSRPRSLLPSLPFPSSTPPFFAPPAR